MCPEYWSILDPLEDAKCSPTRMQRRLHNAIRDSFTSRGLYIPPLPHFCHLHKNAIQQDAPRPPLSCGTFAVSATLHILLGGIPPHSLPNQFITLEHMMALHRALLEMLRLGTPPDLWSLGCLHPTILPPQGTCRGPYDRRIIAAAILLPKGNTSIKPGLPYNCTPTPPNPEALPALNSPHISPQTNGMRDLIPTKDPQGTPEGTTPPT
jgi:hypothetical protein